MDYGQLALLKAQELEAYIKTSASKVSERRAVSASFYPRCELHGGYEPCFVYGTASIGVTAELVVRAPTGASKAKVGMYFGNKIAAYATVNLSAGQTERYTLLASVYPSDGERLKIEASDEGIILEEFHVLAEGSGAAVSSGEEMCKSDYVGDSAFIAREDNGNLKVIKCGTDKSVNAAHGSVFDISASGQNLCVICRDDLNNLWGIVYDVNLTEKVRKNLGEWTGRIALGQDEQGLTVAGVKERKVYIFKCGADFSSRTDWIKADFETEADDVYLSKQSDKPVLFIRRGKTLYAKIPTPTLDCADTVRVRLSVAFLD